mgnify:CR=1 FL=1|jgi:hypothetical protein
MAEPLEKEELSQEELLLGYMQQIEKDREDRRMVHLHLSNLSPNKDLKQNIQTAVSSFKPLVSSAKAKLFSIENSDIYLFFKNSIYDQVNETVYEVSELFADDPLISEENTEQNLFTWFDIEKDFSLILQGVQKLTSTEDNQKKKAVGRKDARFALKAKQKLGYPLTPRVLAKVETALARADLSSLVRRQIVCRVDTQMATENLFSELFISIQTLRETILPDVNLASNRWLFQHLTTTFDKRMLAMLGKKDVITYSGDLSLNINVSTVLSPEFKTFDEKISGERRGALIIELQKEDIFSDLDAYVLARDFVQNKGYKVCIDGLTLETFSIIDRERLGADLTKLIWNPNLTDSSDELREKIRSIVKLGGGERTILCRCDNSEGIEIGHSLGIELFQGRYVETLIIENERRLDLEKLKKVTEKEDDEVDKKDSETRGKQAAGKPGKK